MEPVVNRSPEERSDHKSNDSVLEEPPNLPKVEEKSTVPYVIQKYKFVPQLDKDELLKLVSSWTQVLSSGSEFSHLYKACEPFGMPSLKAEYYLVDGKRKAYVGQGGEVVIHVAIEGSLEDPLIIHARKALAEFMESSKTKGKHLAEKVKTLEGVCSAAGLDLPLEWRFKESFANGLIPTFMETTPWMKIFMDLDGTT